MPTCERFTTRFAAFRGALTNSLNSQGGSAPELRRQRKRLRVLPVLEKSEVHVGAWHVQSTAYSLCNRIALAL